MKFLRLLTHNWPAKVLSLLAALLVWFVVSAGQQRAGTFPGGIPLLIQNVPDGLVAIADVTDVQVTLLADRVLWQRFTADQFTASVNLAGRESGVVDLAVTMTTELPGVEITRVDPERVLVRLEPITEKVVPVSVRIDGQAADGFAPGEAVAEPGSVTARGPESQLDQLDAATALLTLTGERRETTGATKVQALVAGQTLEQVTISPETVAVRVPITRTGNVKTVGVAVTTTGALPSGFVITSLQVKPSVVTITGETSAVATASAISTEAIDLVDVRQTTEVTVPLVLPAGLRVIDESGGQATVTIRLDEVNTTRSLEVPATIASPNRTVRSVTPALVTVQLSGSLGTLQALSPDSVRILHTLEADRPAGTQTVELTPSDVTHPSTVSVLALSPAAVAVELE